MMAEQTPGETVRERRRLLTRWLERKLAEGVPSDDLPSPEDLEKLAEKGLDAHFPLDNRPAVDRYRPELRNLLAGGPTARRITLPTRSGPSRPAPSGPVPVARTATIPLGAPDRPDDQDDRDEPDAHLEPAAAVARESATANELRSPGAGTSSPRPDIGSFAPYELGADIGLPPATLLSIRMAAEGGLRYRWAAGRHPAAVQLYRVVARDDRMPFSPDDLDSLLEVTTKPEVVDRRPMTRAVRYLKVWLNEGADDRQARGAQPAVVVQDVVVAPPLGAHVAQDGDQVTGDWTVCSGVRRVEVYRLPVDQAHASSDPEFQICAGTPNLGGFVDEGCRPGAYLYRLYAVTELDGQELRSAPAICPVQVEAPLAPVTDLRIVTSETTSTLTLEWTAPLLGEVEIYRTSEGAAPGVGDTEIAADVVNGLGRLSAEQRLHREIERIGSQQRMTRVIVPPVNGGLAGRLFFTPVTVHQDRAWIGRSAIHYRFGEIVSPRLVQRVEWQLVSFGWPAGATAVQAHVTPPGERVRQPLDAPVAKLDFDEYRLQGGLVLDHVLPSKPCDLHLTPVLDGPRSVAGRTVTLHYPGLIRLRYRMIKRMSLRRERPVEVLSDSDVRSMLRFVAIHHPDRLPLSPNDGVQVAQWSSALRHGEWIPLGEVSPRAPGFVRIFVDHPEVPVDIAMIDPHLDLLKW